MAIKDLDKMLDRYKSGEIANVDDFEKELNKSLSLDWVPKTTFNELNEKHKLSEKQSKELSDQLSGLKDKAGLADEYKSQIDKLTESQNAEKQNFEKQLADLKNGYALDAALTGAKAKNVRAVKGLLDMSKISFDGDNIKGLDDQLKALKESDAYLFDITDEGDPNPTTPKPFFGNGGGGDTSKGGAGIPTSLEAKMRAAAGLN